jgi:hypothetical protein
VELVCLAKRHQTPPQPLGHPTISASGDECVSGNEYVDRLVLGIRRVEEAVVKLVGALHPKCSAIRLRFHTFPLDGLPGLNSLNASNAFVADL